MQKLVYFVMICLAFNACAQNKEKITEKKKVPNQDSLLFIKYLDSASVVPLFSLRRQLYLDSALQINPKNAQLWQQKAMPLFKQKKYELGMPYIDNAVKYDKTNHFLAYRAFIKCIFQKSYKEALKDFDLAIQKSGNSYIMDHTFEFYKGLCYLQLNQIDSAEYFITKTIKERRLAKGDELVHHLHLFYQGVVQMEKENYPLAIQSLDECLKKYPQLPDALYYKAICLYQQKNKKAALELFLQAQAFMKQGYGINEDNAVYEAYPYQINEFYLDGYVDMLKEETSPKN